MKAEIDLHIINLQLNNGLITTPAEASKPPRVPRPEP